MKEEPPVIDSMPEELQRDIENVLSVSIGNKPKSLIPDDSYTGNKKKFLESIEKNKKGAMKICNNKIYALDITTEYGAKKYSEVLDDAGNPETKTRLESIDKPVVIIDPSSQSGFKSIIVLRTCEVEEVKNFNKSLENDQKNDKVEIE